MPIALAITAPVQWVASCGGSVGGQARPPVDHLLAERLDPRGPGLVAQQPVDALLGEALLPAPDAGLGLAGPTHDLDGAEAVGREQHDLGSPDMLLRRVAVTDDRLQAAAIGGFSVTEIPGRMPKTRMRQTRRESPIGFTRQIFSTSPVC